MTDYRLPMHQGPPRRKPVANLQHGYSFQSYDTPPSHQLAPHPPPPSLAHNRTRTSSSTVLPYSASQQYQPTPAPQHQMTPPVNYPPTRRLSSAATSTSSGGNNHGTYPPPHPDIRRSTSSRSANAQLGYVGLLRRQKATVWCDRAQAEDPRLRAQKMAEKKRAYLEVHGAGAAGRSATLGSGKIKHSGKGTTDFSPSTLVGGAVPVRLSANEVGDADEDAHSDDIYHRRPGSGRSSLGSGNRFPSGYQRPQGNSSPPNEKTDLPEVSENPPANPPANPAKSEEEKPTAEDERRGSIQEENFDAVPDMQAPSAAMTAVQKAQKAEELRRRGSVDDRSTSMTGVRLFVANPDLSD